MSDKREGTRPFFLITHHSSLIPSPSPFTFTEPEHRAGRGEGERDDDEEPAREHPAVAGVAAELPREGVGVGRGGRARGLQRARVEAGGRTDKKEERRAE